jgi:hypothetical protein
MSKCQVYLGIQELLLGNHVLRDVLDLRSGVLGLLRVRVRGHDAPVKLESSMQVLRRVVRSMRRRVLLASLCESSVVSHVYSSGCDVATFGTERDLEPVRQVSYCFLRKFWATDETGEILGRAYLKNRPA